jgi:heme oxygenase (biliverdin-producing, ferredoxin)
MNDLAIDEAKADAVVDEANAAFGMNMVMFNELEGNLIKAIGIQLFNLLTRKRNRNDSELATAE